MKVCIIKNGQLWVDCPDHINIKGGHGEFKCIHVYKTDATWDSPKFCNLNDIDFDIEELFVI